MCDDSLSLFCLQRTRARDRTRTSNSFCSTNDVQIFEIYINWGVIRKNEDSNVLRSKRIGPLKFFPRSNDAACQVKRKTKVDASPYFSNSKNNFVFRNRNGENFKKRRRWITGVTIGRDYGQLENLWFGHISILAEGAKTRQANFR